VTVGVPLVVVLTVLVGHQYLQSNTLWKPPTKTPTGGNVPAPIHTGTKTQIKTGSLWIQNKLLVDDKVKIGSLTIGGGHIDTSGQHRHITTETLGPDSRIYNRTRGIDSHIWTSSFGSSSPIITATYGGFLSGITHQTSGTKSRILNSTGGEDSRIVTSTAGTSSPIIIGTEGYGSRVNIFTSGPLSDIGIATTKTLGVMVLQTQGTTSPMQFYTLGSGSPMLFKTFSDSSNISIVSESGHIKLEAGLVGSGLRIQLSADNVVVSNKLIIYKELCNANKSKCVSIDDLYDLVNNP